MNNKLSITNNYNKNMIPCIFFGEYGWNFIFVDITNNTCVKSEDITKSWLKSNNISESEFTQHCWNEYESMKDCGVDCVLISYFSADDETVYNFAKTIDVAASYIDVFNH